MGRSAHAEAAAALATDPERAALADALITFTNTLSAEADSARPADPPWWARALTALRGIESRLLPEDRYRKVMRVVLMLSGLSSIVGGLVVLPIAAWGAYDPTAVPISFERTTGTAGRLSFTLYAVSAAAAVGAGVVLLRAARALGPKRLDIAAAWRRTVVASVVTMAVVNTAGAYIDQFASLSGLATSAVILAAMASFTTRSGQSLDGAD